ncbi:PIN-like domain-containing protein [Thiothrix unzii]|jgi:hypothetical protein|uniref:PIN-like domain-containing protein n=1 Tax=Thiothrix unzii TaxID=111769 RepID=UPI002A363D87|nr:PIN-like domain-containing protein [Thiothrix unzii]MDX9987979.1 PIN-like domain-containing protein [Thiothrix unzii]
MKDLFPGHFKESEKSLKNVWNSSLFVFDANILLNLYRYSDTTRNEFLRILNKIKGKAWLPHRAAEEYLNNRLSVIDQQEKSYDDTKNSIDSLRRDLENARQHPFVSKEVMEKANSIFEELIHELEKSKLVHTTRISNDEIKDSIASIFEVSVGLPYEKERLDKLIIEGEDRYKQKVPPGFKDGSKSGDSDVFSEKCRKYGDLIVWTQVIDKAIEIKKGVVFVTDDKKEDWWEKFKGKTIGPRPELVKEFKDRANQTFHMYQADRFLELARENLGEQVSEEIVEEIREVRRLDKLAYRRMKEIELYTQRKMQLMQSTKELEKVRHQVSKYEKEMYILQEQRHILEREKSRLKEHRNNIYIENGDSHIDENQLTEHYYMITKKCEEIEHRVNNSQVKYQDLRQHMVELEQDIGDNMKFIEQINLANS